MPQSSTGFSPFELFYGHTVQGSLEILKESWQGSIRGEESVVSHILAIREQLERTMKLVESNLKRAQEQRSVQYNRNAKQREFAAGDLVLVLLPTTQDKLCAKWQEPYQVLEKKGRVNYLIDMHDHQKRKRVYHVNLLKKWETPVSSCMAQEVDDEEDLPDWRASGKVGQRMQLGKEEREDIQQLLQICCKESLEELN